MHKELVFCYKRFRRLGKPSCNRSFQGVNNGRRQYGDHVRLRCDRGHGRDRRILP